MPTDRRLDTDQLVQQHNVEIEGVKAEVSKLGNKIDDIYGKLDRIMSAVSGIGRADTKTILQVIALIVAAFVATVTFVSVIGGMALSPIVSKLSDHENELAVLQSRALSNRTLTIHSNEVLRGALIEQERQINTVERVHIAEIRGLQSAINTSLIARNIPPIPFAELLAPMQAADIPDLLSNSNGQ